jgi:outer membrane protein OmpA-like peptidoglycan-associated protein
MAELHPTLEDLKSPLTLATSVRHRIVLPPRPVRIRMVGMLFETDKTFLLPSAMPGIRKLIEVYDKHTGKTVLVSGHADRAGTATHNLALSVERAQAMAAFLQDQADDWLARYKAGHQKSQAWGRREDQHMLSQVKDADGAPYFAQVATGRDDEPTRAAIKRFQSDNGLTAGAMNADTRRLLIQKYMATDGTTLPAGTSIEIHGCGESHPSVATKDSVALAENRRVEIFFFHGPVTPPAVKTCPAAGCAEYPIWVERSSETIDINSEPEVLVFLVDEIGLPLRKAAVQIVLPDGTKQDVLTDDKGCIRPRVAPGDSFDVIVKDAHEGGPNDSLTTPSGRHFEAGGTGPTAEGEP